MLNGRNVKRALGLTVVTALTLAACGDDSDSGDEDASGGDGEAPTEYTGAVRDVSDDGGEPVSGGTITVGLEADTDSWLPGSGSFAPSGVSVGYAIYDPLIRIGVDGEPRPYLAESLEPNEDLTEWTLTLREGIEFHDGTPLNAEALLHNFDNHLNVEGSNTDMTPVEEMTVEDELTVVYHTSEPYAGLPDMLTLAPGWPFSPTAADEAGEDAGANPVGTGPFVFESWDRDNELVVTRNEDYWQEGLPYLDGITFQPIPDEDTRISALNSGGIDVLEARRQSSVVDLRDTDGLDNYEHLGNNTGGATFNTAEPPFDDLRVRQAAIMSVEQESLIDVLGGQGVTPPATQVFAPDDPYWSEAAAEAYSSYDVAAATELLNEYMEDPDRSDGEAPGSPVSFEFDCPPDPSLSELSQMYQAQWEAIGFEVSLNGVEQSVHVQEALAGDYQAKCFRFGEDRDPAVVLGNLFRADSPQNWSNFSDDEMEGLIDDLRAEDDLETRQQLVADISVIMNENAPLLFTANTLTAAVVQDHVHGIDGWTFPEGEEGASISQATVNWVGVWTDQG